MASGKGISFLYQFDLGNRDVENPGSKILRVTSTADGDFDKANLTSDSVRHVWRSADALTLQEIVIEADLVENIDTFAILGHNFTPSAVVKVQANFGDVWTSPPFEQQIVVDEETDNLVIANDGFGAAYQFYRITILDPSNPCGHVEVGRVIGGRALTFQGNEDIVDNYSVKNNDEAEKMRSQGYFRVSNENVVYRVFSSNFQKLFTIEGQDENFRNFRKMWKSVKTTRPFLMVLDRDSPTVLNMWGQFTDLPSESFGINKFASFPIEIEEVF